MARLPSTQYIIQIINGHVVIFEEFTEKEVIRFNPNNADETAKAQKVIYESDLSDEDKSFAHFWSGYFYAHSLGIS